MPAAAEVRAATEVGWRLSDPQIEQAGDQDEDVAETGLRLEVEDAAAGSPPRRGADRGRARSRARPVTYADQGAGRGPGICPSTTRSSSRCQSQTEARRDTPPECAARRGAGARGRAAARSPSSTRTRISSFIDKPAGLVVHPAPGHATGTLVNALISHCGDSLSGIGGVKRPGIVHRLDKDTSGLLVVAKTDAAHRGLAALFADHGRTLPLTRTYLAVIWGKPDRLRFGTVDAPVGRHGTDRLRMAVVPEARGRVAITHWRLRESFGGGRRREPRGLQSRDRSDAPDPGAHGPIPGIRCWAIRSTPRGSAPRRSTSTMVRAPRWAPLRSPRPCTRPCSASSIRSHGEILEFESPPPGRHGGAARRVAGTDA